MIFFFLFFGWGRGSNILFFVLGFVMGSAII